MKAYTLALLKHMKTMLKVEPQTHFTIALNWASDALFNEGKWVYTLDKMAKGWIMRRERHATRGFASFEHLALMRLEGFQWTKACEDAEGLKLEFVNQLIKEIENGNQT